MFKLNVFDYFSQNQHLCNFYPFVCAKVNFLEKFAMHKNYIIFGMKIHMIHFEHRARDEERVVDTLLFVMQSNTTLRMVGF